MAPARSPAGLCFVAVLVATAMVLSSLPVSRVLALPEPSARAATSPDLIAPGRPLNLRVVGEGQPEPTPEPEPVPKPVPTQGLWLSQEEVLSLPTSGAAWQNVVDKAKGSWGSANLSDQDSQHDVLTLAGALYAVRTGDDAMRDRVIQAIESAMGTEQGGQSLALGRNLVSYVVSADLIGYRTDRFVSWLDKVRTTELSGRTLISTHEDRPNNWGTHAGASRIAADLYLGDFDDLERAVAVFKGWLGDRSSYSGFKYGSDLSWQADPSRPVGINPKGSTREGHSIDGVLPDDQRRGGSFQWPPPTDNYVWEGLQGATVQAQLLWRAGYPTWEWEDQALLRAVHWLYEEDDFPAVGDDTWQPWLINYVYGASFPTTSSRAGKNMGYTDWTHG